MRGVIYTRNGMELRTPQYQDQLEKRLSIHETDDPLLRAMFAVRNLQLKNSTYAPPYQTVDSGVLMTPVLPESASQRPPS